MFRGRLGLLAGATLFAVCCIGGCASERAELSDCVNREVEDCVPFFVECADEEYITHMNGSAFLEEDESGGKKMVVVASFEIDPDDERGISIVVSGRVDEIYFDYRNGLENPWAPYGDYITISNSPVFEGEGTAISIANSWMEGEDGPSGGGSGSIVAMVNCGLESKVRVYVESRMDDDPKPEYVEGVEYTELVLGGG